MKLKSLKRGITYLSLIICTLLVGALALLLVFAYGGLILEILDVDLSNTLSYSLSVVKVEIENSSQGVFEEGKGIFTVTLFQSRNGPIVPAEDFFIGVGESRDVIYYGYDNFDIEYVTGEENGYVDPGDTFKITFTTPRSFGSDDIVFLGFRERQEDSELLISLEMPLHLDESRYYRLR